MEDLFKSKEQEFYIELEQERYFFPGENISGDVIYHLTKETKVTNIKVILEGTVEIGGRSMSLFSKYILIAKPANGDKYELLEPRTHRFPFTITIPTSQECKIPSTLEINKLLKIRYHVTAILNKPYSFLQKLNASTTKSINILEDINVAAEEYKGEFKVEKKVYLSGEQRPVTVSTVIKKRAAVKGDTIPISVNIEHIGVMVRDKAISVQLLRSVYYGKNNTELFGPKVLREVTANIEISGPVSFTKLFNLQLAIPTNLCPTVEKSAHAFRIEYTLQVSVNLNEENPLRQEVSQDVVLFNFPFTIGTYPKVSFNIDDDEDEEVASQADPLVEDEASNNSSEYEKVMEKMKDMDLELEAIPPQMIQETSPTPPPKTGYTPLPALSSNVEPTYIPPPMMLQEVKPQEVKPLPIKKDIVLKPDEVTSPIEPPPQIPMMLSAEPPKPIKKSPTITPLERLPSSGSMIAPFATPKMEFATNVGGGGSSGSTSPIKLSPVQTFNSPKSPVSNQQPVVTTPPLEHNAVPPSPSYRVKQNVTPSDVFNDYNPTMSPSPSLQTINDAPNPHPATPTPSVERHKSFHWVAPPAATPAVKPTSPPAINLTSKPGSPPALPPRPTPTPSISNQTNGTHPGGFAFPQPMLNNTSPPPPPPLLSNNNYPAPNNNYNQHYTYSQNQNQPAYNFPQAQAPPYNNYPPQYNNNYHHQQQNNNNYPYPPPQPQPFITMPSHQDYQAQPNYSYYRN